MNVPQWILANSENLQFAVFFTLLPALALAERFLPRRPRSAEHGLRWRTNLGLTLVNVVALSFQPVSLFGAAFWAEARGWGLFNQLSMPLALLVVGNLLARGFISFATHFLMHRVPLFWRLHRVHHLDTDLDVSSTVRFHPLEFLVTTLPAVPMVVVFGLTPWVLAIYELLDVGVTLFTHSNLRLPRRADAWLRRLIVTPDLHRVHHSTWRPETDSNFGAVFPVWDIVFGTYRTETRESHETMKLGLDELRDREAHNLWYLLRSPFTGRPPVRTMLDPSRRQIDA